MYFFFHFLFLIDTRREWWTRSFPKFVSHVNLRFLDNVNCILIDVTIYFL